MYNEAAFNCVQSYQILGLSVSHSSKTLFKISVL